jgi:PAS domain S-box-containing protein
MPIQDRPRLSLRTQLIVLILLAALPLFLLFVYTSLEQRQQLALQTRQNALQLARIIAAEQEDHFENTRQLLSLLSQLPVIQRLDTLSCGRLLKDLLKSRDIYANLGIIGADGYVVCSAVPYEERINLSDRPYFVRALTTQSFSVGEYQIGRLTGKSSLNFGYPIIDKSSTMKGVIYAALDLSRLAHFASQVELPAQSTFTLLDRNGTILAAYPHSESWVGRIAPDSRLTQTILREGEGVTESTGEDGVRRIVAFTPLRAAPEAGYVHVSIGISQETVFAEIHASLVRNLVSLALVMLIAIVIAWLGSSAIVVNKVNIIIDVSKRMATGDLSARTGLKARHGDLGRLGQAFDEMANSLQRLILERESREAKLSEQARLLDVDPDAIMVIDPDDYISFWNKGAERMYGWNLQEVTGKKVIDLLPAELHEMYHRAKEHVMQKSEWGGEWKHLTKGGKPIDVETKWSLVRDAEGKPKAIYAVNTDITEKKKIEAQLFRAQRLESLGTLAGGIAHDLNNILGPILLSAQVLRKGGQTHSNEKILDMVEAAVNRGSNLVKQILTFARGSDGERSVIQPKALIQEMETIVKETFPKSIQMRVAMPNDLWTVLGDATQLHQVLLNLCVNARDAMSTGGILTMAAENVLVDDHLLKVHRDAKAGAHVLISVADTGTGMSKETLGRIFEPFFTTKDIGRGTGLGLSTVLGIIKGHGGFVDVYSEQGKGTQFKVYLPAIPSSETQRAERDRQHLPVGQGQTVLVIDDESSLREMAKSTLEAFGYKTLVASDGAEAVSLFAQHWTDVDIVICDMNMPFMDGTATIRSLQRINPEVKIIAVSGMMDSERGTAILNEQKIPYIEKPYTAEKLLKTLAEALRLEPEHVGTTH